MTKLPGALIVVDVHRERNAVREARTLHIPTVCLIDTDSDPDFADIPIPGNDDAMRAIDLVLSKLTDAIEVGMKGRQSAPPAEPEETGPAPRRRSRRPATGQADRERPEAAPTDASPDGAVKSGSAKSAHSSEDSDPDLTPTTAAQREGPS